MRLIISADWHIRSDKPRCRLDEDWETTQEECVRQVIDLANSMNAILIIDGDIFDTPNVPSRLVSMLIAYFSVLKNRVYFLAGNHDLPGHNVGNINNCSIGILRSLSVHHKKVGFDFNSIGRWADFGGEFGGEETGILFTHRLVFKTAKDLPPNVDAVTAQELLVEYPDMKWIFTGDMHKSFHYNKNGRHVINPGCLNRQAADMKDYQPIVYFVDTEKEIVEECPINDHCDMVTDEYLVKEKEKEDRIAAFVEGIKVGNSISLDFIKNIKQGIISNRIEKDVEEVIESLIEGGN